MPIAYSMRFAALPVVFLAALAFAVPAQAATYYVSNGGSDAAAGTSATSAWRTVARVNRASLVPGDVVLFRGGQVFSDDTLMPSRSGATGSPISFGSFGSGQANLSRGVWMISVHDLVFENISVIGTDQKTQGIASSASGSGVSNITVKGCTLRMLSLAVNLPNPADSNWTIEKNDISRIGDSGLLIEGQNVLVVGNTITSVGQDGSITYGKHGVYAKGPNIEVKDNKVSGFPDSGVSIRYQNDSVVGNQISDGPIGVSYYQYSNTGGISLIAFNRISNVSDAGIYLDPSMFESFVIANNSIQTTAGAGMDLRTVRDLTVINNAVFGKSLFALLARSPSGSYVEHHNLWHSGSGTAFSWNKRDLALAGYRSASDQGASDIIAEPVVGSDLAPLAGSPLVDRGTDTVNGIIFSAACDGLPFHYCGVAPDLGALDSLLNASPVPAPVADKRPPVVKIRKSTPRTKKGKLKLRITARVAVSDPSGIRRVVFMVDRKKACSKNKAPYKCSLVLRRGMHTIVVRATDNAGNTGTAMLRSRIGSALSKKRASSRS